MKRNDLVGQKFGRLTVTHDAGRDNKSNILWGCVCDCGGKATAHAYDLRAGKIKSCKCLWKEGTATTHGKGRKGPKRSRVYSVWAAMIQRCSNQNDKNWDCYGARGITVAVPWGNFLNFYNDMGDPPAGYTLERVDNTKGYSKENCCWVTHKAQNRNKRSNIYITINGDTKILNDWVKALSISNASVQYRIHNKGESHEQVIKYFTEKRGLG